MTTFHNFVVCKVSCFHLTITQKASQRLNNYDNTIVERRKVQHNNE